MYRPYFVIAWGRDRDVPCDAAICEPAATHVSASRQASKKEGEHARIVEEGVGLADA